MKWILIIAISIWPTLGFAGDQCAKQIYSDPKVEPDYSCPGPGEEAIVPKVQLKTSVSLEVKKPAPWSGILMDQNRVMVLGLRIKGLRRLRWQDMRKAEEMAESEKKYQAAMHQAVINLRTSQRDNYKKQAQDAQAEVLRLNKWYHSKTFWFTVGFVTAAAGATALAFGLRK